jgi:hypothetical protein
MTRARELADLLTGGQTITTADNTAQLTLSSTDADANVGPLLVMMRDSTSPADNDILSRIDFKGDNDAGEETFFGSINAIATDVSDGTEDAQIKHRLMVGGAVSNVFELNSSEIIFNEDSKDIDFRVESNGNANMLFVDAGNDKIGIGTNSGSGSGQVTIRGAGSTRQLVITDDDVERLQLYHVGNDSTIESSSSGSNSTNLIFKTSSSGTEAERVRISSGGRVGIGQSSPAGRLDVNNNGATTETIMVLSDFGGTGAHTQISFNNTNGQVGTINTSGSATSFNTSSDRRLKSNIEEAASASDKIDAIQVRQFDWNVDDSHQDYGLIAQELQAIAPIAVTGNADSDEMMGVDYSKLVPMLLKEIQELRGRVAALEAS